MFKHIWRKVTLVCLMALVLVGFMSVAVPNQQASVSAQTSMVDKEYSYSLDAPYRVGSLSNSQKILPTLVGDGNQPQKGNGNTITVTVDPTVMGMPSAGFYHPTINPNGRFRVVGVEGILTAVGCSANGNLRVWTDNATVTPTFVNINLPFAALPLNPDDQNTGYKPFIPNYSTFFVSKAKYAPTGGNPAGYYTIYNVGLQSTGSCGWTTDITRIVYTDSMD